MAIPKQLYAIFKKGSKTYFYSSLLFPNTVRDDIFILYSFVRVADNFVDAIPQQKKQFFDFKQEYLTASKKGSSENIVIDQFVKLMKRKKIDKKWVTSFLDAMEQDLKKSSYKTIEETEQYMYGSAEVIGLILCAILDISKEGYKYAKLLGKSMQYINFIRDVSEDIELGRNYLPLTEMKKYRLKDLSQQTAQKYEQQFNSFIRAEIERYFIWQAEAEKGFQYIPKKNLLAIKTASDLYKWTANQIYKNPLIIYNRKVKPSLSTIITQAGENMIRPHI